MACPRLRAAKRPRAIFQILLLPVLAAGTMTASTLAATRTASGSSGLVAAYSFDAGSGSTAADASGNGNTGTLTNTSWTSAGKYGGALSFDGKSSYVTVADNASLDLSSALTLEAWVYPTASPTGSGAIVAKERAGGGFPYGFETTGGVPDAYVNVGSSTVASAASALPKNSWTYVTASYDGALLRLYVNGAQVSSTPVVGSLVNSADPLRIGADLTWGEYFQGRIDDVRVYNRALSGAEIQTDMATAIGGSPPPDTQAPSVPAGLATGSVGQTDVVLNWSPSSDNVGVAGYGVYLNGTSVGSPSSTTFDFSGLTCGTSYTLAVDAYDAAGNRSAKASLTAATSPCPSPSALVAAYSFDAGSGSTAADDSGNGNAGTLANASWTSAGEYGGALSFNGSSSYVTVADNASLDLSGALTLEAWVYPTASGSGSGAIVAKERAGGGLPYGFETTGGVPDAYINVGSHASVSGTAALPLNSWTFVSASYDGTLLRLYVNGAQVSSVPAVGSVVASADPLRIGADLTWGEYFQGRIDNVRVYSRALAAAEIQTDMATAVGYPPAPPDTQPPSVPAGLAMTGATQTSVSLSWSASTDNVGVTGYGVYKNSVQAQTSSTTSATVSGLSCGTSYTFAVDAYDAAGNHSAKSASLSASTSTCSDTQAPTVPTNLQTTSTSQTSVSISWTASTDNVGVSGYGLYQNNANVGSTGGTMFSFNSLACGTSYALAVDAYDAVGNRSTKAAITASTSACSVGGAAVYVSPTGSDSNGCTQFSPCLSFDRAYHVAAPGQVVQVAAGTYPEQTLLYDASKEGATQHVVIQPAPAASVTINGNINISNTRGVKGASHLTIQNMTVLQDIDVEGCGVPDGTQCPADLTSGSNDLTFQNLRVKGPYAWVCHSCSNIQILGGVWGPDTYLPCHNSDHPEVSPQYDSILGGKLKRPNHILLDGTRWQNFSRCSSADHTECLQFEPADYVTIRNSVFTHCDTITLAFFDSLAYNSKSDAGLSVPDHIVIEDNFIDQSYDATGGGTYNGLQIPECTNCVIRYNSWLQNAYLPTTRSFNDQVIGNVGPQVPWSCGGSGVTFSHNVFEGATCGPTDKNVADILFVNRSTLDLHLKLGSPAINAGDPSNYPATDFDGQARPLGGAPDAGADEAG